MKDIRSTAVIIGTILIVSTLLSYSQKPKKKSPFHADTVHTVLSRGFSTTLEFKDPKGERVGQPLKFGIHLDATYCVDMKLGESFVPPLPPSGIGDIRFMDPRDDASCMDLGISNDFRPYVNSTQIDTYLVSIQANGNGYPITLSWSSLVKYYKGPVEIMDQMSGKILNVNMKKTNSAIIPRNIRIAMIIAKNPLDPLKVK